MNRSRPLAIVRAATVALTLLATAVAPALVTARSYGPWGTGVPVDGVNSPQADGCPIESPDGLWLYFASTRPGAVGGATDPNDIWRVRRASKTSPWGTPEHLPAPVNSAAADFCPTPLPGGKLYFVTSRGGPGTCGAGDIHRTREHPRRGWSTPEPLGCVEDGSGPNFAGGEFSPSLFETRHGRTVLYFSSTGRDGLDQDIYASVMRRDGSFGPPRLVEALSTDANDQMPNVSRDGLEIVFASDRTGGAGAMDIYTSRRASTSDPWSAPVNVGPGVNTAAGESRPSLSGDGTRLHFGRLGDLWVSTRTGRGH